MTCCRSTAESTILKRDGHFFVLAVGGDRNLVCKIICQCDSGARLSSCVDLEGFVRRVVCERIVSCCQVACLAFCAHALVNAVIFGTCSAVIIGCCLNIVLFCKRCFKFIYTCIKGKSVTLSTVGKFDCLTVFQVGYETRSLLNRESLGCSGRSVVLSFGCDFFIVKVIGGIVNGSGGICDGAAQFNIKSSFVENKVIFFFGIIPSKAVAAGGGSQAAVGEGVVCKGRFILVGADIQIACSEIVRIIVARIFDDFEDCAVGLVSII